MSIKLKTEVYCDYVEDGREPCRTVRYVHVDDIG